MMPTSTWRDGADNETHEKGRAKTCASRFVGWILICWTN